MEGPGKCIGRFQPEWEGPNLWVKYRNWRQPVLLINAILRFFLFVLIAAFVERCLAKECHLDKTMKLRGATVVWPWSLPPSVFVLSVRRGANFLLSHSLFGKLQLAWVKSGLETLAYPTTTVSENLPVSQVGTVNRSAPRLCHSPFFFAFTNYNL